MQHEQEKGAWVVSRKALERRQQARENAMSLDEFGEIEIEESDLDTARITGRENPRTYEIEPYGDKKGPIDYREHDPRF